LLSQAAVERAKQLRDERKKGTGTDDTEHTFTPQINQRPAYLNKAANDSLDVLASTSQRYANNSNDVFEQPLPGNRSQQSIREKERERDGMSNRGIPSPTSDALGNEMRRLSTREKSVSNLSATKSSSKPYSDNFDDATTSYERQGSAGSRQQKSLQRQSSGQLSSSGQHSLSTQLSPQGKGYQKPQYQQPQYQHPQQTPLRSSQQQQQQQQQHYQNDPNYQYQDQQFELDSNSYQIQTPLQPGSRPSSSQRPLSASQRPLSSNRHRVAEPNMGLYSTNSPRLNVLSPRSFSHQNILQGTFSHQNILQSNLSHQNILQGISSNGHNDPGYGNGTGSRSGMGSGRGSGSGAGLGGTGRIPNDVIAAVQGQGQGQGHGQGDFIDQLRQERDDSYSRSGAGPGW
jgi:hypothetical protein